MEKTIQLERSELSAAVPIEQQITNAWAQVGMMCEQLEFARKNRDVALEQQRSWVRQTLAARGIESYQNWRLAPGAIIVTLNDETPATPTPRPNGAAAAVIDVQQ